MLNKLIKLFDMTINLSEILRLKQRTSLSNANQLILLRRKQEISNIPFYKIYTN